jgi:hypothetical protein
MLDNRMGRRRRQFLSSLLSSFSQSGELDPVGRNLTQAYAHALKADHRFSEAIFGAKIETFVGEHFDSQQLEIITERSLEKVNGKNSPRADICITHKGEIILVAEIKVEDQLTPPSKEQLKRYVRFSKLHKKPFFYITKYALSSEEDEILKALPNKLLHKRHHHEIANKLKLSKSKDGGIELMIAAYLEDQNMSGYQQLHGVTDKDLLNCARRILPVLQSGYGSRLHGEERTRKIGPIMDQTLNNARMIAGWLQSEHQDELKFSVYPCVELFWRFKDALKAYKKNPDGVDTDFMEPQFVGAGRIYFCAVGTFTKISGPPIWMTVSLWLGVDKKKKLDQGVMVEFESPSLAAINDDDEQEKWWTYFEKKWALNDSEDGARRAVSDAVKQAQKKLHNLRRHPDKGTRRFATSKAAQYVANMKFRGLATRG